MLVSYQSYPYSVIMSVQKHRDDTPGELFSHLKLRVLYP